MEEMPKLNLGCGYAYRPGYINIDKHERSVADVFADVGDLPFESNSVGTIEAIQILEHFDLVHCKYVLSEWFRVLKPGGTLSIETPDLKTSLKRLTSSKKADRAAAVQWLYGIDSPGLQHKGGFTHELLEEILVDIGYGDIRKRPARTHTYAPGMRLECRKPGDPGASQFMASLRKRIKKHLGTDDSFVLVPLEEELTRLRSEIGDPRLLDRDRVRAVTSLASVWNPAISTAFFEECVEARLLEGAELGDDLAVLRHLSDIKFHERVLTLWTRSRKEKDSENEFASFVERMRKTVREILERPELRGQLLEYVSSLDPTPIEILDLCLMKLRASASLNIGILRFHRGDLRGAEESFSESLKMNPQNPLAHWNLARIGIAMGHPDETILHHYAESISLANNQRIRNQLDKERCTVSSGERKRIDTLPISEYHLLE
jgi:SAM-dependent methyltransferase